jgi:hypothetical protein
LGSLTADVAVEPSLLHRMLDVGITFSHAGGRLRFSPPARLTPAMKDEVTARKPELLAVISRLEGMHETRGQVPIPCAVVEAVGGPGHCFSCGDAIHPGLYGRCTPCAVAVELFYRGQRRSGTSEAVAGAVGPHGTI